MALNWEFNEHQFTSYRVNSEYRWIKVVHLRNRETVLIGTSGFIDYHEFPPSSFEFVADEPKMGIIALRDELQILLQNMCTLARRTWCEIESIIRMLSSGDYDHDILKCPYESERILKSHVFALGLLDSELLLHGYLSNHDIPHDIVRLIHRYFHGDYLFSEQPYKRQYFRLLRTKSRLEEYKLRLIDHCSKLINQLRDSLKSNSGPLPKLVCGYCQLTRGKTFRANCW